MGKPQEITAATWDFRRTLGFRDKGEVLSLSRILGKGNDVVVGYIYGMLTDKDLKQRHVGIDMALNHAELPYLLERTDADKLPSMELASYIKLRQMPEAKEIGKSSKGFDQNTCNDVCAYVANRIGLLPLRSSRHLRTASQTEVFKEPDYEDMHAPHEFCRNFDGMDDLYILPSEYSSPEFFIPSLIECGTRSLLTCGLFRDKLSDLCAPWP